MPYDYQSRLAGGDEGRACESQLISIPTGLGKTAAVLAWLWNRVVLPSQISNSSSAMRDAVALWPRRLAISLPTRTPANPTTA